MSAQPAVFRPSWVAGKCVQVSACLSPWRTAVGSPKGRSRCSWGTSIERSPRTANDSRMTALVLPGFWPVSFRVRGFEKGQLWQSGGVTPGCSQWDELQPRVVGACRGAPGLFG